jgi:hypothetical protein
MRRRSGVLFLAASILSAAGAEPGKPRFELAGPDTCDLGVIGPFDKQAARFRLKNVGTAPGAVLRLIPTCSCINGTADKTWVQPQEEVEIHLVLDPLTLKGTFKRVLWVDTTAKKSARFPFTLTGSVRPLFDGLPEHPQQIVLPEGASWTNRLTRTPTVPAYALGPPAVEADTNALAADVAVIANAHGQTSAYTLTLTVSPRTSGRHTLVVALPVEGSLPHPPVKLAFHFSVGLTLKIVPSSVRLSPADRPQSFFFNLMPSDRHVVTTDKNLTTNRLSWTPERKGVSVLVQQPSDVGCRGFFLTRSTICC